MQHQRRPSRVPSTPALWLLGTLVALTVGCAQSDPDDSSSAGEATKDAGPSNGGVPWMDATPEADAAPMEGSPPSTPAPPPPPPDEDADAGAPVPPPPEGMGVPCEVSTYFLENCQECHSPDRLAAHTPLVTFEDLHADSTFYPGQPVYERVLERMTAEHKPMPPPPNDPATEAQLAAVRAWVEKGAPAEPTCEGAPPPPPEVPGKGPLPPPNPECDHVFELRAHGVGIKGDETPYQVPPLGDLYINFVFNVPWTGSVHGLEFHPIVDDDRVLHHMLLYAAPLGAVLDGAIIPGIGTHPGESLVAGWAPGGEPMILPEGVGMELPVGPAARFVLEVHYNNMAGYLDAKDRSGYRVCATSNKREQTAASHLLGTEIIAIAGPGEFRAVGMCHPYVNIQGLLYRGPMTIISSTPHLHRRGRNLRTEIHRANGQVDVLLDEPFDFDNQITHDTPNVINPGDWLKTTCTYENERGIATFGVRTDDEMCQNYVLAYPVGPMDTGGSLIFEAHACML
ncbi:hypothetical protein L6V77_22035 [Myxococcota bacterium]|nr:hypothetical protein [Myxococcota bacterium]